MPLCIHSESTDPSIDIFDREATFVESTLKPLHADLPDLKIVMEHITTKQGVDFVLNGGPNVGGTITPQHLLYNRNSGPPRLLSRRSPRGWAEAPLLLSPNPEARGASPGAAGGGAFGLQATLSRHGLGAARAGEQGVQEGLRRWGRGEAAT